MYGHRLLKNVCVWVPCNEVHTRKGVKQNFHHIVEGLLVPELHICVLRPLSTKTGWMLLFCNLIINYAHNRTHRHCRRLVVILKFPFRCENNTRNYFAEIGCQVSTINFLWLYASNIIFFLTMRMVPVKIIIQVWGTIPVWELSYLSRHMGLKVLGVSRYIMYILSYSLNKKATIIAALSRKNCHH